MQTKLDTELVSERKFMKKTTYNNKLTVTILRITLKTLKKNNFIKMSYISSPEITYVMLT